MPVLSTERSPGAKLAFALLVGLLLSVPLFTVWLLVYDRQQQSEFAQASIAEGWGGPQTISGPLLVIPYRALAEESVTEGGRQVTRTRTVWRELTLSPELSDLETEIRPERRTRSIYEVVVYEASARGRARFAIPEDLSRFGVALADMDLARAELRFGLSDPRGLGANPQVTAGGRPLRLQPGGGGGPGFFAWIDAAPLAGGALVVDYQFAFRGNRALGLAPRAGDTRWQLRSAWPHPSFQGSFLPAQRQVSGEGFTAVYRVGNLALGQALVTTGEAGADAPPPPQIADRFAARPEIAPGGHHLAQVSLMQPVDLYSRVNRSAKYGFLFIGFTFLAFLLFDVIGGVRVSAVEYLLVGAGLVLFFVLLLAFAEVIGFAPAYVLAAAAIAGLNTAYSAAVLKSWRRAFYIGGLLVGLYALLYILLSLEEYSLLIGSLMLFVALAAVMYVTRNLNWAARPAAQVPPA
ncbi:cell envelope integrity protein CreD [Sphingosinicella sp. CPCC 101087]|uniref:cell envelope integrity protein CreD n=1 Tax=Sphingosinicella sp. CPCC 101087 TaxID=2497754 RepID=UPI00101D3ED0|nr:cell envelope integrity protein CreD [Sphingosinicella sp. CPCC 101087]